MFALLSCAALPPAQRRLDFDLGGTVALRPGAGSHPMIEVVTMVSNSGARPASLENPRFPSAPDGGFVNAAVDGRDGGGHVGAVDLDLPLGCRHTRSSHLNCSQTLLEQPVHGLSSQIHQDCYDIHNFCYNRDTTVACIRLQNLAFCRYFQVLALKATYRSRILTILKVFFEGYGASTRARRDQEKRRKPRGTLTLTGGARPRNTL